MRNAEKQRKKKDGGANRRGCDRIAVPAADADAAAVAAAVRDHLLSSGARLAIMTLFAQSILPPPLTIVACKRILCNQSPLSRLIKWTGASL